MTDVVEANPRAVEGGNQPPEPTPFEMVRDRIEDLCLEARNWADGEAIDTQVKADEVSSLIELLRKAKGDADTQRKIEAKPFDDGKAEVQARYNPLIQEKKGKADVAIDALKALVGSWLKKLASEQAQRAAAAAAEAQAAADAAAAARALADPTNLEMVEEAKHLTQIAEGAANDAAWARKQKAQASGATRAMSLRTYWSARIVDETEAMRTMWRLRRPELLEYVLKLANSEVQHGPKPLPGFVVEDEQRPV